MEESESGYIGEIDPINDFGNRITDVEILRVSQTNVVARGRRHGRLWLLKGLIPELRESTTGLMRLAKEFEIHSRLSHASVVHAVNIENVDTLGLCIVMEWVEGETLADLMRDGRLSSKERRRIMRDIIAAVEHLHRNGVVHRDLKPSNIMVRNAGGEVVIIDFGLADSDNYTDLKQPAGTKGFISPEQIENGGTDTADDVYSLGVIMNELCPGMHRLARRCIGPRSNRPSTAGQLLKLIDHRDKIRKRILIATVTIPVVILCALGIRSLTVFNESAKRTDAQIDSMVRENQRNAQYIEHLSDSLISVRSSMNDSINRVHSRMNDSLNLVRSRMADAELELKQTKDFYRLYEDCFRNGCSMIDAKFNQSGKKLFSSGREVLLSELSAEEQALNDVQMQQIEQLRKSALKAGLSESEATRLKSDLSNYYLSELTKRHEEWMKKITQKAF